MKVGKQFTLYQHSGNSEAKSSEFVPGLPAVRGEVNKPVVPHERISLQSRPGAKAIAVISCPSSGEFFSQAGGLAASKARVVGIVSMFSAFQRLVAPNKSIGEGPALISEELRLEEILRDRRAVDIDERPVAPRPGLVENPRQQPFKSRLTGQFLRTHGNQPLIIPSNCAVSLRLSLVSGLRSARADTRRR